MKKTINTIIEYRFIIAVAIGLLLVILASAGCSSDEIILTRIDHKCGYGRITYYTNPEHTKNKALRVFSNENNGWSYVTTDFEYSEPYPSKAYNDLYSKYARWYTKEKTDTQIYNYTVSRDTTFRAANLLKN